MNDDARRDLDEATRPRVAGGVRLTEEQQHAGAHLRAIHDHFRAQLAAVVGAVAEVRRGEAAVVVVREAIHDLAPRLTRQQLGGFCGQLCQHVTLHHTIEDRAMFPAVASLPDYAPVVDRLVEEHHVIHEHLVRVDDVVVAMAAGEDLLAELEVAVRDLERVLGSHFRYEEEELGEALGLLGLSV